MIYPIVLPLFAVFHCDRIVTNWCWILSIPSMETMSAIRQIKAHKRWMLGFILQQRLLEDNRFCASACSRWLCGCPRGPGRNNHRLSKKTLSVDWTKFYCVKSESLALAIKSEYKASSLHDSQRGTVRSYHPPQFWWRIFAILPMEFVNRVHWV